METKLRLHYDSLRESIDFAGISQFLRVKDKNELTP